MFITRKFIYIMTNGQNRVYDVTMSSSQPCQRRRSKQGRNFWVNMSRVYVSRPQWCRGDEWRRGKGRRSANLSLLPFRFSKLSCRLLHLGSLAKCESILLKRSFYLLFMYPSSQYHLIIRLLPSLVRFKKDWQNVFARPFLFILLMDIVLCKISSLSYSD